MLNRKGKRICAVLLAVVLAVGGIQFPKHKVQAAAANLALSATASASTAETADFPALKANDGNEASRWGSAVSATAWLQLAWPAEQTFQAVRIKWERRNVQGFKLQKSSDGTNWTDIYTATDYPSVLTQAIKLENAVTAKYLRINMDGTIKAKNPAFSETSWQTASIFEFEVYRSDIPDGRSQAKRLADAITSAPVLSGSKLATPQMPEGASAEFQADYEQVIGTDGTVYTPLTDKTVKGIYKITCAPSEEEENGSTAKTAELTISVSGKYRDGGTNPKPDVIPELQEWHGTSGNFYAGKGSRIVIGSDALSEMARLFADDYKKLTGAECAIVRGSRGDAKTGDFYFSISAAGKGLGKEGYSMDIGNVCAVEAEQETGAYWATRTILQILKDKGCIAKGEVRDYPKYEVRGFSLDVGRKPFALDALYEFAENMSWYKMNSFQLHLSDNLIFHEDYPSMQAAIDKSYAGFRLESGVRNSKTQKTASAEDVCYTKDEFRSFILESRTRGIDIVPEFDMPAHALPFTRAFQDLMTKKEGGQHTYLIEELNLEKMEEVVPFAQSIWNDYFEGENPVFDEEMTVHIGTDEYHGTDGQPGKEMFREFSDRMIAFVQGKGRKVRMWGSLSNKTGTTPVRSDGVQLNIWNMGYANPKDMYDLGFDLINTLEEPNYIVPAAGYYNDYINVSNIYGGWQPNVIGNLTASAGDEQMLGACYAIWHDSVDTRANGISQYDSFDRFFKAVSAYGAKLWGDPVKSYADFTKIAGTMGTAPGTTLRAEVASVRTKVADYQFGADVKKDSGANGYDLGGGENTSQADVEAGNKALVLGGGTSYLTTPDDLDLLGESAVLTAKVKLDADAAGEQIICESKEEFGTYGTYAFKAVQKVTGKVGFSREGYDYSFNYTLPKNEWHTLEFRRKTESASLYVDGVLIDSNPEIRYTNHEENELTEFLAEKGVRKTATMLIPLGRIGSKKKSMKGQIDFLTVTNQKAVSDEYGKLPQTGWTSAACSVHSEGPIAEAHDGDPGTYWHQNWSSDTAITGEHHWYEVTLPAAKKINRLFYLPRQDSANGRILGYSIEITKEDGSTQTVIDHAAWANNADQKTAEFAAVMAKKIKLKIHQSEGSHATIAELNLGYVGTDALREDLGNVLESCKGYNKEDYTDAQWNSLNQAKEAAADVLGRTDALSTELFPVYAQLSGLTDRMGVLGIAAKKIALADRAAACRTQLAAINREDYEADSIQKLEEALDASDLVLANESASYADLSGALARLSGSKPVAKPGKEEVKDPTVPGTPDNKQETPNNKQETPNNKQETPGSQQALTANTEYPVESGTYQTTEKTNEVILSKGENTKTVKIDGKVTINGTECTIVGIADGAFKNADQLTNVTIGDAVTSIGSEAFSGCKKLTSVTIGKNVKSIGKKAFYNAKRLKTVIVKSSVLQKIPKDAFKNTKPGLTVDVRSLKGKKKQAMFNRIKAAGAKKPKIK